MKNKQTGTISRVLSYIKRYNVYMILSLVASVVMVISTLYFPILTGDAIDLIIGKGNVDFVGIAIVLKKMIKVCQESRKENEELFRMSDTQAGEDFFDLEIQRDSAFIEALEWVLNNG